jgi:hypothetical protein
VKQFQPERQPRRNVARPLRAYSVALVRRTPQRPRIPRPLADRVYARLPQTLRPEAPRFFPAPRVAPRARAVPRLRERRAVRRVLSPYARRSRLRRTSAESTSSPHRHRRPSTLFKGRPPPRTCRARAARHGRRLNKLQFPEPFVADQHTPRLP